MYVQENPLVAVCMYYDQFFLSYPKEQAIHQMSKKAEEASREADT